MKKLNFMAFNSRQIMEIAIKMSPKNLMVNQLINNGIHGQIKMETYKPMLKETTSNLQKNYLKNINWKLQIKIYIAKNLINKVKVKNRYQ